jgi:SAM-dependent methyltransferase
MSGSTKAHWEGVYRTSAVRDVSLYQPEPEVSLELIDELGVGRDDAILDVGGGGSSLAARLLARGFSDITVLDVSSRALELAREDLGAEAARVHWIARDLLRWSPQRRYDLWHDRAVLHFLVEGAERERYLETLRSATRGGAKVVIGTFAADGPARCSGLPVARYDIDGLASAVGDAFVTRTTRREEHRTPGGSVQPFTWVAFERTGGSTR